LGSYFSQIDRLVVAFEAETKTEVHPDRWFKIRNNLDDYYRTLEQLLQITAVDYLDAMLKSALREKTTQVFSDSLPELGALYKRAIRNRNTLDQLRQLASFNNVLEASCHLKRSIEWPARWHSQKAHKT